ncbi:DUF1016 N-terminal domain-containing protein [Curvibacter lanceolatus]|uniref:DUF1016 N-terminal domain-containing protein n=1 Tax=Curvibacter lanceolatus TaxID=86182 RepID=UPI000368E91E
MPLPTPSATSVDLPDSLLTDLRNLIDGSRQRAAAAVNIELTLLYWSVGQRIHAHVLVGRRAEYGQEVLPKLALQLVRDYGQSFSEKNLRRMVQFASQFSDEKIVVSLIRQLSWTHFIALLPLKDPLQRDFYAQMACTERWSVRTLRGRIDSMLYERTALSQQPAALIEQELTSLWQEEGPAAALGWVAAWAMA